MFSLLSWFFINGLSVVRAPGGACKYLRPHRGAGEGLTPEGGIPLGVLTGQQRLLQARPCVCSWAAAAAAETLGKPPFAEGIAAVAGYEVAVVRVPAGPWSSPGVL